MICAGALKPAYPACGLILPLYIEPENPNVYYSTIADKNRNIVGFQPMTVDEKRIISNPSAILRNIGEEELVCFYYVKADNREWFHIGTLAELSEILSVNVNDA